MSLKVIAFDADDTLWANEHYFQEAEHNFCTLLEDYLPQHSVNRELLKTELDNMPLYGYGIKAFTLSMIETATRIADTTLPMEVIERIVQLGKDMLQKPVELLDGVQESLIQLNGDYRLVMATKGDLLDQERKLKNSGLEKHFHHIEIMSDKKEEDYSKLIRHLDISPSEFMMIGNSLKSDVLPVLNIGGYAIHIPFHITWEHEKIDIDLDHENFRRVETIKDILKILKN